MLPKPIDLPSSILPSKLTFQNPKMEVGLPGGMPAHLSAHQRELAERIHFALLEKAPRNKDMWLYNNASDSYRDPEETAKLVFVPDEPHEARVPDDTDASYKVNQWTQHVEYSLNDAKEQSAYERRSLRLRSGHHLCSACLDVFDYYCAFREAQILVSEVPFREDFPC